MFLLLSESGIIFWLHELMSVEIGDEDVVNAQFSLVHLVLEAHQNVAKLVVIHDTHGSIKHFCCLGDIS